MSDFYVIDWDAMLPTFDTEFFSKGSAISIGGFDGFHLGHVSLLERLKKNAKGLLKGVLTFYSPPTYMLSNSFKHGTISTLRLKKDKIKRLGFDFVVLVDFSSDFAKMKGEDFVKLLKKYLNLKYLIVGNDFRFGQNRSCSIEDMQCFSSNLSFTFEALYPVLINGKEQKISSSSLRASIYDGNIRLVNSLLEERFTVDLLDLAPCVFGANNEVGFRKKDIMQVLPKEGEFDGIVCFRDSIPEAKVSISLDEDFLKLLFNNVDINKVMPYFDILKFI
ncbi:MAG: hypothetical protein ACTTKH_03790 [Treponema sp.]